MILRKPDGNTIEGSISRGKNTVLMIIDTSTGLRSREDIKEYIKKGQEKLEDYELISANENERKLLKQAEFKFKGL